MVRLLRTELSAYQRPIPISPDQIKPILIILSPRDIKEAVDAFNKIDYVDKVWFKYFSKPQVVKEIITWVELHPEYTHIILVLDDVECPFDSVKTLMGDLLYYDFPVLCGCFNFCNVWMSGKLYCTWCEEGKDHEFVNVTFDPVLNPDRHSGPSFHFVTEKWRQENPIIKKVWFQGFPLTFIRRDIFFKVGLKIQDEQAGLFCSDLPWAVDCSLLGVEQFCDFRVKLIHHGDKRNRDLMVDIKKPHIIFEAVPSYERALEEYAKFKKVRQLYSSQCKDFPKRPYRVGVTVSDEFYTGRELGPNEWDELYGKWARFIAGEVPNPSDYKYNKVNLGFERFNSKLNVLCLIDQWGWAFDFEGRGLAKYSRHNVMVRRYCEFSPEEYAKADVVLFMHPNLWHRGFNKGNRKFIMSIRCSMKEVPLGAMFDPIPSEMMDGIACINQMTFDIVKNDLRLSKIPTYLVYAGIDPELFKPSSRNYERFVLGWAGYKERKCKRCHLLERLGFPLRMKCDWGDRFFVKGRSQQPMVDWYKTIDCYVSLSWSEGLPQPILEAMASGIPVVATPAGAIGDVIDKEWQIEYVADDYITLEDAKEKLQRLADDPELRKKVGERNRQKILDTWSWEHIAKKYDDMFEEVCWTK